MVGKKYYTQSDALAAMQKYCASQDRCQSEVRQKLISGEIYGEEMEQIIAELISEGFIDESRYAEAYARGKCKINLWGRRKIEQGLRQKDISTYCIDRALKKIDATIYYNNAQKLIEKKFNSLHVKKMDWTSRQKTYKYMADKGYESELILSILQDYS